jgi:hypothetical protein
MTVKKTRKHTERGGKFQAIAAGYEALKSPLAPLYGAAADHYHECDPPIRHHDDAEERTSEREEQRS